MGKEIVTVTIDLFSISSAALCQCASPLKDIIAVLLFHLHNKNRCLVKACRTKHLIPFHVVGGEGEVVSMPPPCQSTWGTPQMTTAHLY